MQNRSAPDTTSFRLLRRDFILGTLFVVGYTSFVVCTSPTLTYFFDEWSLLQSQTEPLGGAFVSHMGHFFPLGRFVFWIETLTFGSWYRGFIGMNAALHALCVLLFWRSMHMLYHTGKPRLLHFAISSIFLTSVSAMYSIQFGMQIAWHLCIFFCLLILNLSDRNPSLMTWILLLTGLAMFSTTSVAAIVLLLISIQLFGADDDKYLRLSVVCSVGAVAGGLFGAWLAGQTLPDDENAHGWPLELGELLLGWKEIINWSSALALTWLLAPISIIGSSSKSYISTTGEYLERNSLIAVLTWLVILLFLAKNFQRSSGGRRRRLQPLLALGVVILGASLTVAFRFTNTRDFLAIRYGPLLILAALAFWMIVIRETQIHWLMRGIRMFLTLLLISTAAVGALRFPHSVKTASDVDRITDSPHQIEELRKCATSKNIIIYRSIQNSLTDREICEMASRVRGLVR